MVLSTIVPPEQLRAPFFLRIRAVGDLPPDRAPGRVGIGKARLGEIGDECDICGLMQCSKRASSFDYLIGDEDQGWWHRQSECVGGP